MSSSELPSLTSYRSAARSLGAKSAGAAVLGVAAIAGLASNAQAQIVGVTFTGTTSGRYNYYGSVSNFVSLDTGVASTANFSGTEFKIISSTDYADGFWSAVRGLNGAEIAAGTTLQGPATNFAKDAVIGSATTFTSFYAELNQYGGGVAPGWSGPTGYFGVKFSLIDGAHYGWVKLQTNGNASEWTILSGAYNSVAGESILAGQGPTAVPEPATSAALLALGAAGLVAYRQRKKLRRAA